jgi:ATP-dependent helicase/nuclease subunit B
MIERVFLGWDAPFARQAADWLLARRDELPYVLVLVPTAHAGRRLREALAEAAGGALLSPKIATPGSLLATPGSTVAPDWMERLAWLQVLEEINDWEHHQDLLPLPPEPETDWNGLAVDLAALRRRLQENGLMLADAARRLSMSVDSRRWESLSRLERLVEQKLQSWGMESRSYVLAQGVKMPTEIKQVVLAGVAEIPPLVEKAVQAPGVPLAVLIAAPPNEAQHFSLIGLPLESWANRAMPWPDGEWGAVRLVADPRHEAAEALRSVVEAGTPSNEVALASADTATGDELAHAFTRAGWVAFHPVARTAASGLHRFMKIWAAWLREPLLATVADLFTMPESAVISGPKREQRAACLARLRNDWMAMQPDDLHRRMRTSRFRSDAERDDARELMRALAALEQWRDDFHKGDALLAMKTLCAKLAAFSDETAIETEAIMDWLEAAAPVIRRVKRDPAFWVDLMLSALPSPLPKPPEDRVIDVHGWLEMLFEPGRHLVLCGMNEGKVPARETNDAWLGDAALERLGLRRNHERAARDAFLYQAMLEMRRSGGRVDLFCAKTGSGGEALLPSRLLLATDRDDLPTRVRFLFQGVEPPEAGMRWHADWKWQPRAAELSRRFSVTAFADWLGCPFRFYLKHALRMQKPEPGRVEWNARDFGNIAHAILERWGRDLNARELAEPEALHEWFSMALDEEVAKDFGPRPGLAMRLQKEALRQRFGWLASTQATVFADGWEVLEVERKFEIPIGGFTVTGKVDRIDRHRESGALRVIDYKTGKVAPVDGAHRTRIVATTKLPSHIPDDSPVIHQAFPGGKAGSFRWINLQLPLYAVAIRKEFGALPTPCYFPIGATEPNVCLNEWTDFSENDLTAAEACASWILGKINDGVFWPPAEKSRYDDFAPLTCGRSLSELCEPPGEYVGAHSPENRN